LKAYTPFRLNPRILPAAVSATVAASDAITVLRPQITLPDSADGAAPGESAIVLAGAINELDSPAPTAAIPRTRARRLLEKGVKRSPDVFAHDCSTNCPTALSSCTKDLEIAGLAEPTVAPSLTVSQGR
jgi:hypothetical protein